MQIHCLLLQFYWSLNTMGSRKELKKIKSNPSIKKMVCKICVSSVSILWWIGTGLWALRCYQSLGNGCSTFFLIFQIKLFKSDVLFMDVRDSSTITDGVLHLWHYHTLSGCAVNIISAFVVSQCSLLSCYYLHMFLKIGFIILLFILISFHTLICSLQWHIKHCYWELLYVLYVNCLLLIALNVIIV